MDIYKYPPCPRGRSFRGRQPGGLECKAEAVPVPRSAGRTKSWLHPPQAQPLPPRPSECWLCADTHVQGRAWGLYTHHPRVLGRGSQRASLHCTFAEKKAGVRGTKELAILLIGVPQRSPSWEVAHRSGDPGLPHSESGEVSNPCTQN